MLQCFLIGRRFLTGLSPFVEGRMSQLTSNELTYLKNSDDPNLWVKAVELPSHIFHWLEPFGGIKGRKVLDFGCGFGVTAWGICCQYEPASVLGVDINREYLGLQRILGSCGIEKRPTNLRFREIAPGEAIDDDGFDIVYSWSVFEHVHPSIMGDVLHDIYERIRPGGLFFVQIAPLYFSPEGAHCWEVGYTNWEHLMMLGSDFHGSIASALQLGESRRESLLGMFHTLNRITAPELIARVTAAGFVLVQEQLDKISYEPPAHLSSAYNVDALKTYQVVALFRRP